MKVVFRDGLELSPEDVRTEADSQFAKERLAKALKNCDLARAKAHQQVRLMAAVYAHNHPTISPSANQRRVNKIKPLSDQ